VIFFAKSPGISKESLSRVFSIFEYRTKGFENAIHFTG